jgi:hypothetical protein
MAGLQKESSLQYIICKFRSPRRPRQWLTSDRFGIEFAPEVVKADGNVKNLAWRICNAKKALVSYFFDFLSNYRVHYHISLS